MSRSIANFSKLFWNLQIWVKSSQSELYSGFTIKEYWRKDYCLEKNSIKFKDYKKLLHEDICEGQDFYNKVADLRTSKLVNLLKMNSLRNSYIWMSIIEFEWIHLLNSVKKKWTVSFQNQIFSKAVTEKLSGKQLFWSRSIYLGA